MLCGNHNGRSDLQPASNTLCSSQNECSKPLQGFYMNGGSLNGLSEPLQASYTLCGNQNGFSDVQLVSNTLCSSLNRFSEPLQASYALSGNQDGLSDCSTSLQHALQQSKRTLRNSNKVPNIYKAYTHLAVV